MTTTIRAANASDIATITEIYNDAVANTTAIWNDQQVDEANRLRWLYEHEQQGFPVLVAVNEQQQTVGYATYGAWRAFDGYRFTVEHSVYVHRDARGGGIGKQLMRALIERAQAQGLHIMVAGIDASNHASIALHERLGFKQTGMLPEVGTKFGRWLDLVFLQLMLEEQ
ncbi:GNAT family N-acetyltransferase [Carnimonas nigrificans]|uniref:GNAT family N-acetyltransferase n=1 Tax=Carnimonas nigrificans TaxID=64323 RepID=UPI000472707F|nr:GNAT family N-acetyltransferase [Carnimonas nigrificans]